MNSRVSSQTPRIQSIQSGEGKSWITKAHSDRQLGIYSIQDTTYSMEHCHTGSKDVNVTCKCKYFHDSRFYDTGNFNAMRHECSNETKSERKKMRFFKYQCFQSLCLFNGSCNAKSFSDPGMFQQVILIKLQQFLSSGYSSEWKSSSTPMQFWKNTGKNKPRKTVRTTCILTVIPHY